MGYVMIQVPFSSLDASVGWQFAWVASGWQFAEYEQGTSGMGRRHWQAAAAAAARAQTQAGTGSQALSLRRACFDEGVAFPDKN